MKSGLSIRDVYDKARKYCEGHDICSKCELTVGKHAYNRDNSCPITLFIKGKVSASEMIEALREVYENEA